MYKNKKSGFSIVEVLMVFLVLSIITILLAPFITRQHAKMGKDGVVFTYSDNFKKEDSDETNYCFTTNFQSEYVPTDTCSEYEFTVPKGVNAVNLTLVAGGGGGGGASGLKYTHKNEEASGTGYDFSGVGSANPHEHVLSEGGNDFKPKIEDLKQLTINYLMAEGQQTKLRGCGDAATDEDDSTSTSGSCYNNNSTRAQLLFDNARDTDLVALKTAAENAATAAAHGTGSKFLNTEDNSPKITILSGRGGMSSPAMFDYEVPMSYFPTSSLTKILNSDVNNATNSERIQVSLYGKGVNRSDGTKASLTNQDCSGASGTFTMDGNTDCKYKQDGTLDTSVGVNGNLRSIRDNGTGIVGGKSIVDGLIKVVKNGSTLLTLEYKAKRIGNEPDKSVITATKKVSGSSDETISIPLKHLVPAKIGKDGGPVVISYWKKSAAATNCEFNLPGFADICLSIGKYDGSESGSTKSWDQTYIYHGGAGAEIDTRRSGNCGAGGVGYTPNHTLHYDNAGNINGYNAVTGTQRFGFACFNVSALYVDETLNQKPGGFGGAGGSAMRILGVKVEPGEKYIIRVGKGGKGGAGGSDFVYKAKGASKINTETTDGEHGGSGTSTSIWKKNDDGSETLVYMVMGGKGGYGGSYGGIELYQGSNLNILAKNAKGQNASIIGSFQRAFTQDKEKYADIITYDSNISRVLFTGSKERYSNNGKTDAEKENGKVQVNNKPTITVKNDLSITGAEIEPFYIYNAPHNALRQKMTQNANRPDGTTAIDENEPSISLGYNFYNIHSLYGTSQNSVKPTAKTISGVNIYDGLYHKTIDKNGKTAYIGGLGGFSGLGSRAGCGGMFSGNSEGLTNNGTIFIKNSSNDYKYKNKFIINNQMFNVSDYYDNCSTNTPDGQSAAFVMPNVKAGTFGQAGSGGGGGGYTMDKGAGKGGDGQNGYLMIDWRK